ncbi:TetR/AcrR family transcriptional regulator [Paraburkholderia ginsengiterrae]|nr:TetR/AcrR family transcriptional regulator [Paraburkholderia ginsengiterrae]
MQVILQDGPKRLTTTRVADRAGFSVGTLYQYYANKESLLYAFAQRHLQRVASAVETACFGLHKNSLDRMVVGFVDSFFTTSTGRDLETKAFYLIWPELDTRDLVNETFRRIESATVAMLGSSSRFEIEQLPVVAFMLTSTLVGSIRLAFEQRASDHLMQRLREQFVTMCRSYISSVALEHSPPDTCGIEMREASAVLEQSTTCARLN